MKARIKDARTLKNSDNFTLDEQWGRIPGFFNGLALRSGVLSQLIFGEEGGEEGAPPPRNPRSSYLPLICLPSPPPRRGRGTGWPLICVRNGMRCFTAGSARAYSALFHRFRSLILCGNWRNSAGGFKCDPRRKGLEEINVSSGEMMIMDAWNLGAARYTHFNLFGILFWERWTSLKIWKIHGDKNFLKNFHGMAYLLKLWYILIYWMIRVFPINGGSTGVVPQHLV